jgi:hypothetical protein
VSVPWDQLFGSLLEAAESGTALICWSTPRGERIMNL